MKQRRCVLDDEGALEADASVRHSCGVHNDGQPGDFSPQALDFLLVAPHFPEGTPATRPCLYAGGQREER